jgi:hypothetical protein
MTTQRVQKMCVGGVCRSVGQPIDYGSGLQQPYTLIDYLYKEREGGGRGEGEAHEDANKAR